MQVLLDNMNNDTYWDTTSEPYNPLILLKIIEILILAQTKDQYVYATLYDQECSLYVFHQHNLKNEQYCDQFNTKVDVGEAIGITIQHRVLMEYTAQFYFSN